LLPAIPPILLIHTLFPFLLASYEFKNSATKPTTTFTTSAIVIVNIWSSDSQIQMVATYTLLKAATPLPFEVGLFILSFHFL
jgi:hypothetical protein